MAYHHRRAGHRKANSSERITARSGHGARPRIVIRLLEWPDTIQSQTIQKAPAG